ncbi:MAG: hypothetical protein K6F53_07890 [Lachnospiraceae bacterium]|nr:hypothetical protein [Lachnospiraceae bacterium]
MKITLEDIDPSGRDSEQKEEGSVDVKEVLPQDLGAMEDSRFQWRKMKGKPFSEKLSYFFAYYGIATAAVIVGILLLVSLIRTFLSQKEYGFYAMLVNSAGISSEAVESDFASYASIDTEKYDCVIDTSARLSLNGMGGESDLSTSTKIVANVQSGDLDFLALDSENFKTYAMTEIFMDLRNVLSKEELRSYEGLIYYVDRAEIDKQNNSDAAAVAALDDTEIPTEAERLEDLKKHLDPSGMVTPIPVGILLDDFSVIRNIPAYPDSHPVGGFTVNSKKTAVSTAFLRYLDDGQTDPDKIRYQY